MTIKEFRDYISSFPQQTQFEYGISIPFPWKEDNSEIAFAILNRLMFKEEMLERIDMVYCKGDENIYTDDDIDIHFEEDYSSCDENYLNDWIKLLDKEKPVTREEKFVRLAFK